MPSILFAPQATLRVCWRWRMEAQALPCRWLRSATGHGHRTFARRRPVSRSPSSISSHRGPLAIAWKPAHDAAPYRESPSICFIRETSPWNPYERQGRFSDEIRAHDLHFSKAFPTPFSTPGRRAINCRPEPVRPTGHAGMSGPAVTSGTVPKRSPVSRRPSPMQFQAKVFSPAM